MATPPDEHVYDPRCAKAGEDPSAPCPAADCERVTIKEAVAGWRWRNEDEETFSARTLDRQSTISKVKIDGRVSICVRGLDAVYQRAPLQQELEPSEVSDTLAHALLVGSGLMPTGLMHAVIECFQQARDAEQTASATQLDFLHDRLDEAETQAQKLRVENESRAAELKRAEIIGIERNATITCLRTELELRNELRADHDILIAQREAAATNVDHELVLLTGEVAALRDLITRPKRRLFKRR